MIALGLPSSTEPDNDQNDPKNGSQAVLKDSLMAAWPRPLEAPKKDNGNQIKQALRKFGCTATALQVF